MHEDSDFTVALPANADDLIADLELEVLFTAMAGGDPFLFEVAKCAVLSTLTDAGSIAYRQTMLKDCIANPALIRELYTLAVDALDAQRKVFGSLFRDSPKAIVSWSVEVLGVLADFMARLRALADEHGSEAGAPGFKRFFAMLSEQLDDQYMATVRTQLDELRFGRRDADQRRARSRQSRRRLRAQAGQATGPAAAAARSLRPYVHGPGSR